MVAHRFFDFPKKILIPVNRKEDLNIAVDFLYKIENWGKTNSTNLKIYSDEEERKDYYHVAYDIWLK